MFQRADDKKSNLILNLLSWVDFLRPKFCFFENVRGFLQFSLNATQLSQYRVGGGIKMGGLKFLVYALLAMKYVLNFSLNGSNLYNVTVIKSDSLYYKQVIMVLPNQEYASFYLLLR